MMKGAMVYHQIKSMRKHYSVRDCARRLGVSVNTVRKYESMSLSEASTYLAQVKRGSQYDIAREFIEGYLSRFPAIKATKLLRKVKERYPQLKGKVRGFRRYISPLRQAVKEGKFRYYAPVLDMQPGIQVQVDIGEAPVMRNASGDKFKAYFVSFVFSYSRHAFVTFRGRCYDTDSFIEAHKQAFEYFGGIAAEYVYDQTKLVVIEERYREVFLNDRFHKFALKHGFEVRVCEGYDPQSKGKVERFIGYVKSDFLCGDYYVDVGALNSEALDWLDGIANVRIHGVTNRRPVDMFSDELPLLRPFEWSERVCRFADKTGLISYKGNKYSVPYEYQRCEVSVEEKAEYLLIHDLHEESEIARHSLCCDRGKVIKNNNHYRDYRQRLEQIYEDALTLFAGSHYAAELLDRLRADNPRIARDQLRAMINLRKKYELKVWDAAVSTILSLPVLKATAIELILQSHHQRLSLKRIDEKSPAQPIPGKSVLDRSLDDYMEVVDHAG